MRLAKYYSNTDICSRVRSYKEIGKFWETHNLTECWDKIESTGFEVDIQSEVTYYAVDKELAAKIQALARRRGVSADAPLNLWLQEKLKMLKV